MSARGMVGFSARALRAQPMRAFLSLAGVSIGVAAVVVLTALGDGARNYVVDQFTSLGNNLVIVLPGKNETAGFAPTASGYTRDLTLDDAAAVRRELPEVRAVAPVVLGNATVSHGRRNRAVPVLATSADYLRVRRIGVTLGRGLPGGDLRRAEPVCLIGPLLRRELFGSENPVGEAVRIGEWRYRVIGVLEQKGTAMGLDFDDVAVIPVVDGMRMFNTSSLFRIVVEAPDRDAIARTRERVRQVIKARHDGEDDVTVITQDAVVDSLDNILAVLTLAMGGIAAISLSVAGVGVMNVMLVSVSERVHEIGLLRALGAHGRQVSLVFILEAAQLTGLGGILGVAAGASGVAVMGRIWPALAARVPLWAVLAATSLSIAMGVLFGFLPARRAGRMDPVTALRSA